MGGSVDFTVCVTFTVWMCKKLCSRGDSNFLKKKKTGRMLSYRLKQLFGGASWGVVERQRGVLLVQRVCLGGCWRVWTAPQPGELVHRELSPLGRERPTQSGGGSIRRSVSNEWGQTELRCCCQSCAGHNQGFSRWECFCDWPLMLCTL